MPRLVFPCRWCPGLGFLGLSAGRAGLRPGALLPGALQSAGVLHGRGGRGASRLRRPRRVPGGPERLAELPAPAGVQVPARFSQGGALPPCLLDCEVCRWVSVCL